MENQKNKLRLIALLIVLFLLVLGLGGYIVYDKALSNKETPKNELNNTNTNTNGNNQTTESSDNSGIQNNSQEVNNIVSYTSDFKVNTIDASKLDTSKLDYPNGDIKSSVLQEVYFGEHAETVDGNIHDNAYAKLTIDGRVRIIISSNSGKSGDAYLTNITNAVQILGFTKPIGNVEGQLCYILLSNGDVYYYTMGDVLNNKITATKVDTVKNVSRLFIYSHPKNTWELIAISENNQLISLNKESV